MSAKRGKRKFKPTFENGGFWEYYKDLEHQFEDFLKYVPYLDQNESVRSFRLTNIILNIGGHVDSSFKEMALYRKFNKHNKCKEIMRKVREARERIKKNEFATGPGIKLCLEAFQDIYNLSTKTIIFKRLPERERILPFAVSNPQTRAPYWWDIYNQTKHDFHEYFEKTTLKATRDALAGAFLLNVIHEPAIFRLNEFGLLKSKYGDITLHSLKYMLKRKQKVWAVIETPIFSFDYEQ